MNVIVLLADGVRPDTLAGAISTGALPALARLREDGGQFEITSTFPSVTGPAYVPFLTGRFPGPVGLPGIRWYDRSRTRCRFPDYSRSYAGYQMAYVNNDLAADSPTIFELVSGSVGALSVITRGLVARDRFFALSPRSALRGAWTHFAGGLGAMLKVDREIGDAVVARAGRTPYIFAAFGSADKVAHAEGHESGGVVNALRVVDDTVARLRHNLERHGEWEHTRLWVTSDHGHSAVTRHEDLAGVVENLGFRVLAHPWVFRFRPEVAVMVSGNAMAHVYVDIGSRKRPYLGGMTTRARALVGQLLQRPSVDLLLTPDDASTCTVHSATRGRAVVERRNGRYSYRRSDGDPLAIGDDLTDASGSQAYDACLATPYPDSVVQIAHLASSDRSGDIILSAARDWDYRARFEPAQHVSTHGSLRREHMLVPLLANHAPTRTPRRTVDLMPSSLAALGRSAPALLDGESFVQDRERAGRVR